MPEKKSAPGRPHPDSILTFWSLFGRTGRPGDRFWRSFWSLFPSKMRSKIDTEIEPQKTRKTSTFYRKKPCEKQWNIQIFFMKKMRAKYANVLFFPSRRSISKKMKIQKSLFFLGSSIQNHARNADVRIIEKSLKNDAKMETQSFQNRWRIHWKIGVGKRTAQNR